MQKKVTKCFMNVFATTNPYESVIGEINFNSDFNNQRRPSFRSQASMSMTMNPPEPEIIGQE